MNVDAFYLCKCYVCNVVFFLYTCIMNIHLMQLLAICTTYNDLDHSLNDWKKFNIKTYICFELIENLQINSWTT